jgi:hypothetical protein
MFFFITKITCVDRARHVNLNALFADMNGAKSFGAIVVTTPFFRRESLHNEKKKIVTRSQEERSSLSRGDQVETVSITGSGRADEQQNYLGT